MYRLQATSEIHEVIGHPGAGESLERILGSQRTRIEWMLRKHLGARQDIDDLVQTVYLELLRALPRFRGESSLSTFIGGIALMVVRRARRGTTWDARKTPLEVETEEARAPNPEQAAIAQKQVRRVERALDRISAVKREAYLMHLDGMTPQEIAKETRSSLAATRSRIFYARKELGVRARKDDALRELVCSAG
jgi:RNA polymerase sigma-70 factor (ECF subfamily)